MKNMLKCISLVSIVSVALSAAWSPADQTKSDTGTGLTDTSSWEGNAPGSADVAIWDASSLGAGLSLDSDASWLGIDVDGAAGDIDITGPGQLTLGNSGIETLDSGLNVSIGNPLALGADQEWRVDSQQQLTVSGQLSGDNVLSINSECEYNVASKTFNNYLTTSDQLIWSGKTLSDITGISGVLDGAWVVERMDGSVQHLDEFVTTTYQLQGVDDSYLKGVEVELSDQGGDIYGKANYAGNISGGSLGDDLPDNGTIATADEGYGYGVASTTLKSEELVGTGTVLFNSAGGNGASIGGLNVDAGEVVVAGGDMSYDSAGGYFDGTDINVGTDGIYTLSNNFNAGYSTTFTVDGGELDVGGEQYINDLTIRNGGSVGGSGDWRMGFHTDASVTVTGSSASTIGAARIVLVNDGSTTVSFDVADVDGGSGTDLSVGSNIDDLNSYEGAQIDKTGAGTLGLSGANTFQGSLLVNEGMVKFGIAGAGGASGHNASGPAGESDASLDKIQVSSGATLDVNGYGNTRYGITIAGDGVDGSGALINTGGDPGDNLVQTPFIGLSSDASVGGTGMFHMIESGYGANSLTLNGHTLTKKGANTFNLINTTIGSGTINVSEGVFSISDEASDGSAAAFVLDDTAGAELQLNGEQNLSAGSLSGGGANGGNVSLGSGTLTVGALDTDTEYAGTIGGSGGISKTGSGTWTLTSANTYDGDTVIEAGSLALSGSGAISSSVTIDVQSGATLDVSGTSATYEIASGQTLTGKGTVSGNLSVESGATLSPGASPGTMNVTGDLTLDDADLEIDIWGLDGAGDASGHDQIVISAGALILTDTPTISVDLGGSFNPDIDEQFTILSGIEDWTGSWDGEVTVANGADFTNAGKSFRIDQGSVMLTVIPEPSTGLLLAAFSIFAYMRSRHSRRG